MGNRDHQGQIMGSGDDIQGGPNMNRSGSGTGRPSSLIRMDSSSGLFSIDKRPSMHYGQMSGYDHGLGVMTGKGDHFSNRGPDFGHGRYKIGPGGVSQPNPLKIFLGHEIDALKNQPISKGGNGSKIPGFGNVESDGSDISISKMREKIRVKNLIQRSIQLDQIDEQQDRIPLQDELSSD